MSPMPPIFVAGLFREISQHLIALLSKLAADEWHLPTSSSKRNVKDIVSHLLDGSLRRLSMQRDGYYPQDGSSQPGADEDLLGFLNRLNAEWERATRRLSPAVLIAFLNSADEQLADLFESLDPYGEAIFPVAWAGEERSQNWLDVARDYTEKWYHTQQIFEATGRDSTIIERRLFYPCLDIFMRGLPHAYRDVDAPDGTGVTIHVRGESGGMWYMRRATGAWRQQSEPTGSVEAIVSLDQETAWKVFTRRVDSSVALQKYPDIRIDGQFNLGLPAIEMVSVMA